MSYVSDLAQNSEKYKWVRVHLITYLTDILVSHSADLLDVCGGLGHSLERVASDGQLILLALGDLDSDTTLHGDPAHELLANEVSKQQKIVSRHVSLYANNCSPLSFSCEKPAPPPRRFQFEILICSDIPDLNLENAIGVLVNVDVDGKVCIDVSHLVLEALGDTNDQVVDDGSDGTEGSNVLADTVVNVDGNNVLLGLSEADGNVRQVLHELATRALNGDLASLDVHLD